MAGYLHHPLKNIADERSNGAGKRGAREGDGCADVDRRETAAQTSTDRAGGTALPRLSARNSL